MGAGDVDGLPEAMHKEDGVHRTPREWESQLEDLLDRLEELYGQMRAGCQDIRTGLVRHDSPAVLAGVKRLQRLMARVRAEEKRAAATLAQLQLLDPSLGFNLARLEQSPALRDHPNLCARIKRILDTAGQARREAALNRRLIERLAGWLQREMRILIEPFLDTQGYGARGSLKTGGARPAVLDRRG